MVGLRKSKTRFVSVAVSIFLLIFFLVHQSRLYNADYPFDHLLNFKEFNNQDDAFWDEVFTIFNDNAPDIPPGEMGDVVQIIDGSNHKEGQDTLQALLQKGTIKEEVKQDLKLKHSRILETLPKEIPSSLYNKGRAGVVTVGGGRFSWLAYLAIVSLRRTGSKLPVEVFLPKYADYENELEFCHITLPSLNARCVVIPEKLGVKVSIDWSERLGSYQFKILTMLLSSFEHVLLMDSDNIIVQKPERLIQSSLYKENGLILWPDYWIRSTSPAFYEIAGAKVNDKKAVRYNRFELKVPSDVTENIESSASISYHDLEGTIPNYSTESGQMLINKRTHGRVLLLSLYYNLYGPDLFYKLTSMSSTGSGDKDTFPAAAVVLNKKYYQVKSDIQTIGYFDKDGGFRGVAMGQRDPLKDYKLYHKEAILGNKAGNSLEEQRKYLDSVKGHFNADNGVPLFSLHCNFPKLDPLQLFDREDIYDKDKRRMKYRIYNSLTLDEEEDQQAETDDKKQAKFDFELVEWRQMQDALCTNKIKFSFLKEIDMDDLCLQIKNQVLWLITTPHN